MPSALAAQSVHSAAASDDAAVVEVPFSFVAGTQKLPAGTYRIKVLPGTEEGGVVPDLVTLVLPRGS